MSDWQPIVQDQAGRRRFACFPVGVGALIIDPRERFLLLSGPRQRGRWEAVSGGLEAGETLQYGLLREIREELGSEARIRLLGLLHAYSFPYDDKLRSFLSIWYLGEYLGGRIEPGDDMAGATVEWASAEQIEQGQFEIAIPERHPWIFRRAVHVYRALRAQPTVDLQPEFDR